MTHLFKDKIASPALHCFVSSETDLLGISVLLSFSGGERG